ncbi:MAG: site-specific integrase [Oscillospiraceae bacterium]|nr:site-specific integrase [Oscillospiraceae bacterium]
MKIPKARKLPSGQWFCRVRVDGQDVPITRSTEKAAVAAAMAVKAGLQNANRPENITLSKAIDRYIEDRSEILSPSTIRGYRTIQRNRLQDLMDMPLAKITTQTVQRAVNADAKEVGWKTIGNALGLVTGVLGYHDIRIGKLTLGEDPQKEKSIYTDLELMQLLHALQGSNIELEALLALWLGLRWSEIAGLRWDAVDLSKGVIHVQEALVPDENNKRVSKGTKTAKSTRSIICPDYILHLIEARERSGDHIVTVCSQTAWRRLDKVCKAAGVPCYGFHRMRHQNSSVMALLNIDPKYAMDRGGWASTKVMHQVYTHTMDAGRQQVAAKMDTYFTGMMDPQKAKKPLRKYRITTGGLPKAK